MWFLFALVTVLCWGGADLFYKKGADATDKYSHLRTSMLVGLVMGIHAIYTLLSSGVQYDPMNMLIYLPVSLMYIGSMVIGYVGLRYLVLSICSPVQNASGAVVAILCWIFLGQSMDGLSLAGTAVICCALVGLGILERKEEVPDLAHGDAKYVSGAKAFLFPIAYCVIDALGTFFDTWYLEDAATTPLRLMAEEDLELVGNMSYEFMWLIAAVLIFVFLRLKKQPISFKLTGTRGAAAILETAGQATYVYALSGNGIVAAPMVASYSVVSMLLGRIILKEKLTKWQYIAIAAVMIGILLLGIAEGLGTEAEELAEEAAEVIEETARFFGALKA